MARKKKQIDGQLSFDFCLDQSNYVVQANDLIGGKQSLRLNSAKLIRAAIMQVQPEDEELKPYKIKLTELSNLLGVSKSNISRDIDSITNDIFANPVFIKSETPDAVRWIKYPWVTRCEYDSRYGLALKLNEDLKPFLLKLKTHYTQYTLETVMTMKSVYAIRIFEILQSKIMTRTLPKEGIDVIVSVEELKELCGCVETYTDFGHFRQKVLEPAKREINEKTTYTMDYSYIKESRSVKEIVFHVNMFYH
jgi:plasmid replication initiation protein